MAYTLARIFGVVYIAMGVLGLLNTGLVGTDGFFAADAVTSTLLAVVGAVLLVSTYVAREWTRTVNIVLGAALALVALSGLLVAPERGEVLGMLMSGSLHVLNFFMGALLVASGFVERKRERGFSVYAPY